VAKKATLIGVKVLGDNGSGTTAGVIAGLQWAVLDAQLNGVNKSGNSLSLHLVYLIRLAFSGQHVAWWNKIRGYEWRCQGSG
jgi:hypothetical protein